MGQVDSDTSVWYSLHIFINLQVRDFLTQSLNANPTVKQAFLYCPWICPVYFKLLGNLSRHLIAMNVMAQLYMIWFQKKKKVASQLLFQGKEWIIVSHSPSSWYLQKHVHLFISHHRSSFYQPKLSHSLCITNFSTCAWICIYQH